MKLPANLLYPFASLAARVLGGFSCKDASPIDAMKKCRIPVIFIHGDEDFYVPCYMSEKNFEACAAEKKRLVIIKGAGHGVCFPTDMQTYFRELDDFFGRECGIE